MTVKYLYGWRMWTQPEEDIFTFKAQRKEGEDKGKKTMKQKNTATYSS